METNYFYGGSHQMIRNQLQLSDDIQLLTQRLDTLESQVETLISGQQLIIGTLNQIVKKERRNKKPPLQKKQLKKRQNPTATDVSKLLHLPEALQRNIQTFIDNVLFKSTDIPDELISTDCLSEDECNTLLSKPSKKDQIRLLIKKIKARGPQVIEKFLKIIGKDHADLITVVNESLERIIQEYKFRPVCVICVMQLTVDLRDVGDYLWAEKIISDDIYGDIYECDSLYRNKPFIWGKIIHSLNGYENQSKAKDILINALRTKYDHIVEYLNENTDGQSLSCSCCTKRRVRRRLLASDFGSQTDISTTSAIPNIIFEKELSDDGQSVSSSLGKPGSSIQSYDLLEYYDDIQHPEIQSSETGGKVGPSYDESTENEKYERQFSECFVPQAEKYDETLKRPGLRHGDSAYCVTGDDDRQELNHSVSIVSDVSTICAEQSPDLDSKILEAKMVLQHQEKIINNGNRCDIEDKNDQVEFQLVNEESQSVTETFTATADEVYKNRFVENYGNSSNQEINAKVAGNDITCPSQADRNEMKKDKNASTLKNTENQLQVNEEIDSQTERHSEVEGKETETEFQVDNKYINQTFNKTEVQVTVKDTQNLFLANNENVSTTENNAKMKVHSIEESLPVDNENKIVKEAAAGTIMKGFQKKYQGGDENASTKATNADVPSQGIHEQQLTADAEDDSTNETKEDVAVKDIHVQFPANNEESSRETKENT